MMAIFFFPGAIVMARSCIATAQPKLKERFSKGVLLGKTVESDGYLVGLETGVVVARTIRLLPKSEQSVDFFRSIKWTPWSPGGGKFPEEKGVRDEAREDEAEETQLKSKSLGKEVRRSNTATEMLRKFHEEKGATPGCAACHKVLGRPHRKDCKKRMEVWRSELDEENIKKRKHEESQDDVEEEGDRVRRRLDEKRGDERRE